MRKEIKQKHHTMPREKVFLYSGEIILFFALLFLIVNSDEASWPRQILVPFLLATVALLLTMRFVK